jgi:hypothetical protein
MAEDIINRSNFNILRHHNKFRLENKFIHEDSKSLSLFYQSKIPQILNDLNINNAENNDASSHHTVEDMIENEHKSIFQQISNHFISIKNKIKLRYFSHSEV